MPYRQAETACVVRLAPLRLTSLSATTRAPCEALRIEAGRLWTVLVRLHADGRGQWLTAGDLEKATKGGLYALHSQSIQALCQKFAANVATATALRQQELAETGRLQTEYPHQEKRYQTVVWKDQAIRVLPDGQRWVVQMPTGGQRPPLVLPLPAEYHHENLRRAELTWRADHYELCLTIDTGEELPPFPATGSAASPEEVVAGIDLGGSTYRRRDHDPTACLRCHGANVARLQTRPQPPTRHLAREVEPLPARLAAEQASPEAQSPGKRQTVSPATRHLAPSGEEGGGLLCARGCHLHRHGGCA